MRCRRARRMLPLLAGGEIRGRRAEILDLHVRRCRRCREELARYEASRRSLFRLKGARSGAAPDLWPEIRRRIEGSPEPSRRRVRPWGVAAAALAAALVIGVAFVDFRAPPPPAPAVPGEGVALAPDAPAPDARPVSPGDGSYPLEEVGPVRVAETASFDTFPSVRSADPERSSWDEF